MFTYSGRFRVSGMHSEVPPDDLETAKLHIEEMTCLALLEFMGPMLVDRIGLAPMDHVSAQHYMLEIVLHSPDHSTLLRREMLASARRHIDGTLRPLLTELFGRVRIMRTTLTYAETDAAWGEVAPCVPAASPINIAYGE